MCRWSSSAPGVGNLLHRLRRENLPPVPCTYHPTLNIASPTLSPEIADGWASYDERVDSYSLGILTFELWHPFSTGMERAILLRDLREHGVMPAEFEAANPQVWRRGVKGGRC